MDSQRIKTPRGEIKLSSRSKQELQKQGWGDWFVHHANNGVTYEILYNPDISHACAVIKKPAE